MVSCTRRLALDGAVMADRGRDGRTVVSHIRPEILTDARCHPAAARQLTDALFARLVPVRPATPVGSILREGDRRRHRT